nr:MAG TPA: Myristoyl-CoA:protein N-myristoyltransferase, N-terminal domain [Caudoviricetes sp.]
MRKGLKRVHRLVVLPDYQGIGIGMNFINFIADKYIDDGLRFNLITTTPSMRFALLKSDKWNLKRAGHLKVNLNRLKGTEYEHIIQTASCNRVTYSFDYYRNSELEEQQGK